MNWIIFSPLLFGQEPNKIEEPIAEIIVEASKDYEVFIAPVKYHINVPNVSVSIPHNMVFNYAGMHSRNAKVFNFRFRLLRINLGVFIFFCKLDFKHMKKNIYE